MPTPCPSTDPQSCAHSTHLPSKTCGARLCLLPGSARMPSLSSRCTCAQSSLREGHVRQRGRCAGPWRPTTPQLQNSLPGWTAQYGSLRCVKLIARPGYSVSELPGCNMPSAAPIPTPLLPREPLLSPSRALAHAHSSFSASSCSPVAHNNKMTVRGPTQQM